MFKSQYIVVFVGLIAVIALSLMPKVVVKDDEGEKITDTSTKENTDVTHSAVMSSDKKMHLDSLKGEFVAQVDQTQKSVLLERLIQSLKAVNQYDSAAHYMELFAEEFVSDTNSLKTGDLYYEAYTFAIDEQKAQYLGKKARDFFEQYLANNPSSPDVRTKIGMTYVASSNPMQGIMTLREVLKEYPDNQLTIFNLGILSMQSGQYEKAVRRFEKLVSLNAEDLQAHFYLGICYKEVGVKEKAVEQLEYVKSHETNPNIIATVDKYLAEIKGKAVEEKDAHEDHEH